MNVITGFFLSVKVCLKCRVADIYLLGVASILTSIIRLKGKTDSILMTKSDFCVLKKIK